MNRGLRFEELIGTVLKELAEQFPRQFDVEPQFRLTLGSGRTAIIDFRLTVDLPHERQRYYLELQSRERHNHELADKIEAVRRDTKASTFTFVHETPLGDSVSRELAAQNIVSYRVDEFQAFLDGLEVQFLQSKHTAERARGSTPQAGEESRLRGLVEQLADKRASKKTRELGPSPMSPEERKAVNEIVEEVKRDPDAAIREAKRFLGDLFGR